LNKIQTPFYGINTDYII